MHPARDTGAVRAATIPNPSRRSLFATTAHAAPVALAGRAGDDAGLLALHRTFLAEHAVVMAWNEDRVADDIGEAAHDRWWECVEAITDIPAATPAALRAKAEVALLAYELAGGQGGPDEDLVRSALRDAAAWGGAA